MRVVLQRVNQAQLSIDKNLYSQIDKGYLLLVGFEDEDSSEDLDWAVNKIAQLRIFGDAEDKMNLSLEDISGELLVVSQFTLFAKVKKGNRPSFIKSAKPEKAKVLYQEIIDKFIRRIGSEKVKTGVFGANMQILLENDGPVTLTIDTKNKV